MSIGGRPRSKRRSKSSRGSSIQNWRDVTIALELVRFVGVVKTAVARPQDQGRAGLANVDGADVLYSDVVTILVEAGDCGFAAALSAARSACRSASPRRSAPPARNRRSRCCPRPRNRPAGKFRKSRRAKPAGAWRRANGLESKTTCTISSPAPFLPADPCGAARVAVLQGGRLRYTAEPTFTWAAKQARDAPRLFPCSQGLEPANALCDNYGCAGVQAKGRRA